MFQSYFRYYWLLSTHPFLVMFLCLLVIATFSAVACTFTNLPNFDEPSKVSCCCDFAQLSELPIFIGVGCHEIICKFWKIAEIRQLILLIEALKLDFLCNFFTQPFHNFI